MTIRQVSEKYGISQDTLRYYEKMGMIPPVTRTAGGIRDYQESDLGWVGLAICLRNAGMSVEAMVEYVRLHRQGDSTMQARLELLQKQRQAIVERRERIDHALERLDHKIHIYEEAVENGELTWGQNCSKENGGK